MVKVKSRGRTVGAMPFLMAMAAVAASAVLGHAVSSRAGGAHATVIAEAPAPPVGPVKPH